MFQSRYRAASHFRSALDIQPPSSAMFQSRYRAASHFRIAGKPFVQVVHVTFQSRYRAASHFRVGRVPRRRFRLRRCFNLVIERLLISGSTLSERTATAGTGFQSRYRAASHFRGRFVSHGDNYYPVSISLSSGFSFQVIGGFDGGLAFLKVSISLSSGFSFQGSFRVGIAPKLSSFNLVIERLLISGVA